MAKTHIHVSDLRNFKSCRIRWHFSSPIRGGWSPTTQPKAMHLGTLIHSALEMWYGVQRTVTIEDVWESVWLEELKRQLDMNIYMSEEEADKLYNKAHAILQTYNTWANKNDTYEVVNIEQKFEVPLMDDVFLAGKFDQIVRDRFTRVLWIRDFKVTTADMFEYADYIRNQDDQARAYVFALAQLFPDENVGGSIFTFIRAKAPTIPELNKKGDSITRRANLDTTEEVYCKTLATYGLSKEDYEAEIVQLRERTKTKPWVMETRFAYDPVDINAWANRTRHTAQTMIKMPTNGAGLWPASYFTCRGCPFKQPCSTFLRDGMSNAETVLRHRFVPGKWAMDALDLLEDTDQ